MGNVPKGWHLKDLKADGYYGISLDKAYNFVNQKGLKSTPVIVGIIDSGIDTTHEDLKSVLWVNKKEIPGNGIDDDKNGYIDDIHGWNFLGSNDGKKNVEKDSFEAARLYWKNKNKYEGKKESDIPAADKEDYKTWLRAQGDVFKTEGNAAEEEFMLQMVDAMQNGDIIIKRDLKKDVYTCTDLKTYNPATLVARQMKEMMLRICSGNNTEAITNAELLGELEKEVDKIAIKKSAPKEYRKDVVNDDETNINDKNYGNNNLYVSNDGATHGTHVAGIIGAVRGNGKGMDGVADNVQLMSIRAVPDGDEHDKDIALAIRYAVDNGARIINMSFGKGFSPQKQWVDDAVRYADSKGVLLVHAAGNDAKNNDTTFNYPSAYYLDGTRPKNWITVGASGDEKAGGLVASFSNYGKKDVDVFAPGVQIYATVPGGNTYRDLQGTSMASPVVAGLAAFIMNYYPTLTASQVKGIILQSVSKPGKKVTNPQTLKDTEMSDLSVTGGIVNAYEAIKLADAVSKGTQIKTVTTPAKKPAAKKKN
ncbi:MAG: peptidase S8 [Sphingobacteriales bacterium 41-5]|nr:MAG: peptidase S8 [Sphingobacteriales bacterium 41-5]